MCEGEGIAGGGGGGEEGGREREDHQSVLSQGR